MLGSRLKRTITAVLGVILLLVGVFTACSEQATGGQVEREMTDMPLTISRAMSTEKVSDIIVESSDFAIPMETDRDVIAESPPCAGTSSDSCAPRDVSHFNLFAAVPSGAAYTGEGRANSTEDVLEKGLRLGEASPVHLAVRGTTVSGSTRCDWRAVARTAAQRETAIRFWLGIADSESLPSAAEVERRFKEKLDQYDLALPQTANTSFKVLAQGGLPPFVTPF